MKSKEEIINQIKSIMDKWGGTTSEELGLDADPVFSCIWKNNYALIDGFYKSTVHVTHYVHESVVDDCEIPYEELDDDLLEEVFEIIKDYDEEMTEIYN